jgi:hypothetical protein
MSITVVLDTLIEAYQQLYYTKPQLLVLHMEVAKKLAKEFGIPEENVKLGNIGAYQGIPMVVSGTESFISLRAWGNDAWKA